MNKTILYLQITRLFASGAIADAELLMNSERRRLTDEEYEECLGNRLFYDKEYQKAIPHYETAMLSSKDYDCARYHYLLGAKAEQNGNLPDAFTRYQAAIEAEPSFVDSYVELGALLCKVRDFKGAWQCYTDAIAIDPKDLGIRHNLVQVLLQLAREAPDAYSQALKNAQAEFITAKAILDARCPRPGNLE